MATLQPAGREYISWPLHEAPDDVNLELSLDGGTTWHPLTRDGDTARALVAGPDAENNPEDTIVVGTGRNRATIRATDNPETIIRDAGVIDV